MINNKIYIYYMFKILLLKDIILNSSFLLFIDVFKIN